MKKDLELKQEIIEYENKEKGIKTSYFCYYVMINEIKVRLKPYDTTAKMILESAYGEMGKEDL